MLKFLRKKGNAKKIMWGLAILIIPAFVLWGAGSSGGSRDAPRYAGKIFGKKISFPDYQTYYLASRNEAILRYGQNLSKIAQFLDLDALTWQRIVLLTQAKRQNIRVTDTEVVNLIRAMAIFQRDGRFDQAQYTTVLEYALRSSPREFEEQIRDALAIDKLRQEVTSDIAVTDEDVQKDYKDKNEKAKVRYILFPQDELLDEVHPAHDELVEYYENNKNEFEKAEQVNVEYMGLYFDKDMARTSPDILDEEIFTYFQEHKDEFIENDQESLDEVDEIGDEEIIEEVGAPDEIEVAAEEKIEEEITEEIKNTIKERLIALKQKEALEDSIWEIANQAAENSGSFTQIAKDNECEVKETGFFTAQGLVPEIGLSYEFSNTAFSLTANEVSNAIETPKGLFVMRLKEKKPAHVPPMDEVQTQIEDAVKHKKSRELAKEKAQNSLSQLNALMEKESLNLEKAAKKLSLIFKDSEEFTHTGYISGIGRADEFAQVAFSLKPEELSGVVAVPNGYSILSLSEIIHFDQERFNEEKETLSTQLLEQKKNRFYQSWVEDLVRRAHSEDNIAKIRGEGNS